MNFKKGMFGEERGQLVLMFDGYMQWFNTVGLQKTQQVIKLCNVRISK